MTMTPDDPGFDPAPPPEPDPSPTNLWGREPAAVLGFVQAVIVLAVVFGLQLPEGAEAAILGVSAMALALLTRRKVTPTAKLPEQLPEL